MQMASRKSGVRKILLAAAAVAQLSAAQFASAQTTFTWVGTGGDANWGTGANWSNGITPAPSTTTDLLFTGSLNLSPVSNYTAFDDFRNILFTGSNSFTVTGNAIDLFGKIENNSSVAQTFNLTLDARLVDNAIRNLYGNVGQVVMDVSDLGREDRPGGRWLSRTGVAALPSGSGSRDVQWVQKKARELGLSQSKMLDPMDELMKRLGRAQTLQERDELNKQLQEEAARVRKFLEANEKELLDRAKERFKMQLERRRAAG